MFHVARRLAARADSVADGAFVFVLGIASLCALSVLISMLISAKKGSAVAEALADESVSRGKAFLSERGSFLGLRSPAERDEVGSPLQERRCQESGANPTRQGRRTYQPGASPQEETFPTPPSPERAIQARRSGDWESGPAADFPTAWGYVPAL